MAGFVCLLIFMYASRVHAVDEIKVTEVTSGVPLINDKDDSPEENLTPVAGIGDKITIKVEHLDELMKKAKDPKNPELNLFIDGIAIKGLKPSIDLKTGNVIFILSRDENTKSIWANVLNAREFKELYKKFNVSIGIENESVPSKAELRLIYIRSFRLVVWLVSTIAVFLFFVYLSVKTPILKFRDNDSPYSLSKTQMIVWIFVIISSYMFIWFVMNDFNSINDTAVKLLGLSLLTSGAAIYIDTRKKSGLEELNAKSNSLQSTIDDLKSKIAALGTDQGDPLVALQKELNEKTMEKAIIDHKIKEFPVGNSSGAETFLKDILQDSDGWSLPRVQVFLWTIILVAIFISNVYNQLAMPEFNASLLSLMGISQGAYIGFKIPEKT
jgi:hypothetical protein